MPFARAFLIASLAGLCGLADPASADKFARSPARADARIYFTDLKDGATVPSRFTVHFAADNFSVAPASDVRPNAGHFHILIDRPLPPPGDPIPSDPDHLHFGKAQTEAELSLPPGEHTLQLLMGDHNHMLHDPPVASQVYRVRVVASLDKPRAQAAADARIFFVDLADGATIPTKSIVKFGAAGVAIEPAGADKPNSGHFHLLIDAPPSATDREIPSDPQHIHFGRGQMETELVLTPGPHALQLLLGDHAHVPHDPPVASQVIHVTAVDDAAGSARAPAPPNAAVYFITPKNGAVIRSHSIVRFGLRNMGVSPAGVDRPNTGHHHLLVDIATPPLDKPIPNEPNITHFGLGQTEKPLTLSPGKHRLQLILGDYRHMPHDPPVFSERIEVTVSDAPRKRRGHRRR